jgi:RHS repeat-associated protein
MTSYTEEVDTVTFTYDALGYRVSRTEGDTIRSYVWNYAFGLPSVSVERAGMSRDPIIQAVDLNSDGIVNFGDMCVMADNWGTDEPSCDIGPTRHGDGTVDLTDLAVLAEYWLAESDSEAGQGENDLRYYIYTPDGSLLYSVEAADNSRRDYHYDEMGNVTFLTDDTGAVIGSYAYSPFGRLISSTSDLDNPFTWQGWFGVMDEGNGLYYVRARYYDSATSRFISRDPIKSIGPRSVNPYQYAWSNPLRYGDWSGGPAGLIRIPTQKSLCGGAATRFAGDSTFDRLLWGVEWDWPTVAWGAGVGCGFVEPIDDDEPITKRGQTDEPAAESKDAGARGIRPGVSISRAYFPGFWTSAYEKDGVFTFFGTSGAYSTATDCRPDEEGYVGIDYGIGFDCPSVFHDSYEVMQVLGPGWGGYYYANILSPGGEMALTFRLDLPEPSSGDFDTGAIYFWGEAI